MRTVYRFLLGRSERVILFYKLSHFFNKRKIKPLADFFRSLNLLFNSIDIHPNAKIARNVRFPHPLGIVIGEGVCIEENVHIYQNVTLGSKIDKKTGKLYYPTIKSNSYIYAGAVVVGSLVIEVNNVIGANSFLSKSTDINSIMAGNPASKIGETSIK